MPKIIPFNEKYPKPDPVAEKQKKEALLAKKRQIMANAREALQIQLEKRRAKKEAIKNCVINKATKDLEEIIDARILKHSQQVVKAAFLKAFEDSGGQKDLVKWIKQNPKHRQEFYKMLITLIRQSDEIETNNKAKIVVNIFGLTDNQSEILISANSLQEIDVTPMIEAGNGDGSPARI